MDEIPTIKERIFQFLEIKEIKKESFYRETGMSSSNFKGKGLKSDLGVDKLAKIISAYPELKNSNNLYWLVTGKGKLDVNDENKKDQQFADLNIIKSSEERLVEPSISDLLASIFAQNNTQDKSLLFLTSLLQRIDKKICDENQILNDKLNKILKFPENNF